MKLTDYQKSLIAGIPKSKRCIVDIMIGLGKSNQGNNKIKIEKVKRNNNL